MVLLKVASVTAARNEEEYLPHMIRSLQNQTLRLDPIIIVNDGSTDDTGKIAREYGCIVIDLPYHEESYRGKPEIASVHNAGLKLLKNVGDVDYVVKIDADTVLPPNYIEEIIARMSKNPRLVVASGIIENEPFSESAPRGSGRVYDYKFWDNINGLIYPVTWGWESWILFKAMSLGYETRCFSEITSKVLRSTKFYDAGSWGKGMYALGYDWRYVLFRSFKTFLKSPKGGILMFWNWLNHKDVNKLDVADWVNKRQRTQFWKQLFNSI